MYRGRLWTMRQFAGFGSAEDTNERFHYLSSTASMVCRSRSTCPRSWGATRTIPSRAARSDARRVAVTALRDMEILFDRIPLDQVTTSMTINGPASIVWAMYLAAAEKRRIPLDRLGGTIQNDALKEYIAQRDGSFR